MGILSAFRFAFQNIFFTPVLYGVIASLAVFSSTWEKGDRLKDQFTDKMRSQQDTFDFIVVGGGVAGAVLAYRLSEFHSVLLLEAGGESHPFQAIPGLSIFLPNYPATDWQFKTVPQAKSCFACKDGQSSWSSGRNLGGGGNLNYLIHLRGSPKDFDNWAAITGDPSWSYEEVLPFFRKSENFVGDSPDKGAHGVGGPLQVEIPDYIGLAPEWNHAGKELGYLHTDLNGHYDEGFDTVFHPIKQGVRQATFRSYIQPCRGRSNFLIRKFAHVNRLIIRDGTNEVHGVQYDRHGYSRYAFANKEVILSAGPINSPKILMLSGIGPWKNLEDCGIAVKSDLPVGQNLQDHVSTLLGPFFIKYPRSLLIDRDITPKSFLEFGNRGSGPLSSSGFQATALLASSLAKARGEIGWPDMQLTLFGTGPHRLFPSDLSHAFGLREDVFSKYIFHALNKDAFFILVSVARPKSRGEITLKSQDKGVEIDPRYYCDPEDTDRKVMIEGIKAALHLVENTTTFQDLGAKFTWEKFGPCSNLWFRSDDYWSCYLSHLTVTLNDASGTCTMGRSGDPGAVVDPELKVFGVRNLRVVDSSIMPTVVGANAQAATIMIGEKGAAMILDQWKDSVRNSDAEYENDKNGNNLIEGNGHPNDNFGNNFGNNVPVNQDDFAKLFEDPANFDSYGPLQKALQNPQILNINPSTIFPENQGVPPPNRIPNSENPYVNTQIQPPYLLEPPHAFGQDDFFTPSTTPFSQNSPTTPAPDEFYSTGFNTPGLESTVSTILSTPIPRSGKNFNFVSSPDNKVLGEDEFGPEELQIGGTTEEPGTATLITATRNPQNQRKRIIRRRKRPRSKIQIHPRAGFGVRHRVRRPKYHNTSQVYLDALRRPNIANQLPIVYDYFLDESNPSQRNVHNLQSQNPIRVYVRHAGSPIPDSETFRHFKQLPVVQAQSTTNAYTAETTLRPETAIDATVSRSVLIESRRTESSTSSSERKRTPLFKNRTNRRNITRLIVKQKPINRPRNINRPIARNRRLKSESLLKNMNEDVGNDLEIGASTNFAHIPQVHSFVPVDMDPFPVIFASSDTDAVEEELMLRNVSHYIMM